MRGIDTHGGKHGKEDFRRDRRLSCDGSDRYQPGIVGGCREDAVAAASKSLRDLRIAEVSKLDLKVEDGKVVAYRTRVLLSFKYEG